MELRKEEFEIFKITCLTTAIYMINLILSKYNYLYKLCRYSKFCNELYVICKLLILLKIYNSIFISYESLHNDKTLSGYITEFMHHLMYLIKTFR